MATLLSDAELEVFHTICICGGPPDIIVLLEPIQRGYEVTFTDLRPDGPELKDDTDCDTGGVFNGRVSLDDASADLRDLIVNTTRGKPTKPEALRHPEYFIMYKHQSAPSLNEGCRTTED